MINQTPPADHRNNRADGGPALESDRSRRRRRAAWLGLLAWTLLLVVALHFLLRASAPVGSGPFLVRTGERTTEAERARDWFRLAHVNFSRIYPWVLFGPYVVWLGWTFSLERGRWRVSLPAHLAACAVFALASQAINSRVSGTVARIVIINGQRQSDAPPSGGELRAFQLEVSQGAGAAIREEFASRSLTGNVGSSTSGVALRPPDPFADSALTNLFSEIRQAAQAPLAPPGFFALRPLSTLLDVFAYAAVVGLAHAVHFYRRYRERERCALTLESSLARARLSALQAQLQPHFLFNTLNAIATLLRRDPLAAEATVLSLSDLLRLTLSRCESQESPLREELEVARRYFDIQQTRFGERLRLHLEIEPAAMDCLVPTLILQPLVENAIRHGIEPSENAGNVWIRAHGQGQRLVVKVEDDGLGFAAASSAATPPPAETSGLPAALRQAAPGAPAGGIGLANLRARLDALYGGAQNLELSARPEAGVVVRIEIPWHEQAAGAPLGPPEAA